MMFNDRNGRPGLSSQGRDSTLELIQRTHTTGHKEPVAVAFQFSAIRPFSGADVER